MKESGSCNAIGLHVNNTNFLSVCLFTYQRFPPKGGGGGGISQEN